GPGTAGPGPEGAVPEHPAIALAAAVGRTWPPRSSRAPSYGADRDRSLASEPEPPRTRRAIGGDRERGRASRPDAAEVDRQPVREPAEQHLGRGGAVVAHDHLAGAEMEQSGLARR